MSSTEAGIPRGNLEVVGNLQAWSEEGGGSLTQRPFLDHVRCEKALAMVARRMIGRIPSSSEDAKRLSLALDEEQMELCKGSSALRCHACGRVLRGMKRAAGGALKLTWADACRCGLRTSF